MSTRTDRSTEALALLAEATRILHGDGPLQQRMHRLFELLRAAVRFRDARLTCWLQSAQPGTVRQQYYSADGWPYPWDEALTRKVALGGVVEARSIVVSNEAADVGQLPVAQASYLGAPIFWGGRLWGVLELRADFGGGLAGPAQELLNALLPQLAIAIAQEGRRLPAPPAGASDGETPSGLTLAPARQRQLAEIDVQLEEMLGVHELLNLLLRRALEATGAEAGAVALVDHAQGELVLQVYQGYADEHGINTTRQRLNWQASLAGRAARIGRALLIRDVTLHPDLTTPGAGVRAELAAPIMVGERAEAVIILDSPRSSAFGEEELAFVRALCDRAAHPLSRAAHYQEAVESANYLGQVFANLPTGLALLDSNGKVLRANPAWSAIWGLNGQIGRAPFHVSLDLVETLLPRLQEPLKLTEFCSAGQRSPGDVQRLNVRLSNPTQELQVLSVPTRDSQRQLTGRLWAVTDVTRETESERLKTEFVSIVSHELRTPLTSILGYTELLLNREFSPDERGQFINTVYVEAGRLSQLVEDLLNFSRLEAGKVKLSPWITSLFTIVHELTTQLNTQLKRHRLLLTVGDQLPPVFIDRDKIKQVIFNLLTNAIKYSPSGGEIGLEIREAALPDLPADHPRGRWVLVGISDQGIGIAPEDLGRIWERFYRVDNTNTRRIGGTGLGLSISKALVELHGGRIWARSEQGRGSQFVFTLPVATAELTRRA
jgi:signal transduction histidine kinase/putative methionine-R-sulfoxide reductase with GAF domain